MFKINAVVFIFSVNYLLKCFELSYYMSPRSYTSTQAALGAQILQPSHTGSCKSANFPGAQSWNSRQGTPGPTPAVPCAAFSCQVPSHFHSLVASLGASTTLQAQGTRKLVLPSTSGLPHHCPVPLPHAGQDQHPLPPGAAEVHMPPIHRKALAPTSMCSCRQDRPGYTSPSWLLA